MRSLILSAKNFARFQHCSVLFHHKYFVYAINRRVNARDFQWFFIGNGFYLLVIKLEYLHEVPKNVQDFFLFFVVNRGRASSPVTSLILGEKWAEGEEEDVINTKYGRH